jgi:hypothetical protein
MPCLSGHTQAQLVAPSVYRAPRGFYFRVRRAGKDRSVGPFDTQLQAEAARDGYLVATYEGRKGRPDFYKRDGTLHVDLPGQSRRLSLPSLPRQREQRERGLIEQMAPVMRNLMQDGDLAEAKATTRRGDIATAIGQLLLGRWEKGKPDAHLFLVLPAQPHAQQRAALSTLGITVVVPHGA